MTERPFQPRGRPPEPSERPPPRAKPPGPPAGIASPVTWILGVAFVVVLLYVTVNTLRTDAGGSRGVEVGQRLPPFAAPEVTGPVEGDANVLRVESKRVPRACDVRLAQVVNSCRLAERGPVVLAFLASRSERCISQIDVLERVRRRFPAVQFAAVAIRGDRDDVRRLVRSHRWTIPVAHDRDGAVANAYAVAVCPTITFAHRGGRVAHTTLGAASQAEIVRRVEALR